eukprot:TRINITY_DN4972_c0_g2_i2.p2 TRINITY_DN4972_c0_g2~~TRINITY_DN4972_c0_g2_i2.p2  ORF type:complete len:119 (-),score=11.90 TRINITY_DN4972_c0_g2_i2:355-711(-)
MPCATRRHHLRLSSSSSLRSTVAALFPRAEHTPRRPGVLTHCLDLPQIEHHQIYFQLFSMDKWLEEVDVAACGGDDEAQFELISTDKRLEELDEHVWYWILEYTFFISCPTYYFQLHP